MAGGVVSRELGEAADNVFRRSQMSAMKVGLDPSGIRYQRLPCCTEAKNVTGGARG